MLVCFRGWQLYIAERGVATQGVGSREAALPECPQRVLPTGAEIRQPEGRDVSGQGDPYPPHEQLLQPAIKS